MQAVDQEVWRIASEMESLAPTLSTWLDSYVRKSGMDDLVRVTPGCIGERAYAALREALLEQPRRHVWYHDHGWHLELRKRLLGFLQRRLQRQILANGHDSEALAEDLLAHDVGV
ncbi:hypothetical protein [Pseudomonas monteilii]|uniref:hypothetical protein n=1 Tax=Pseudomonas monteilii TaxID=76759 RepID=UPI001FD010C3|nr:hypothetical protein [Pseudomonas monteilii]MCJ7853073.1 hypothetical protein [Pseudomonas monteilii]